MLKIVRYPEKILFEKMPEFDFVNPIMDPTLLKNQMIETMLDNDGIGLAANQVGIKTNVFVMGHRDYPASAQAFFNPQIVSATSTIEDLEEGCLSFPGIFVKIKRPSAIKAKWQNEKGDWEEGIFEGYNCKCFLHEYDHLQGITFRDRLSQIKWAMATKKAKKEKVNASTK